MSYEIRFTEEAKDELIDITEYIARDSLPKAQSYVSSLVEKYTTVLSTFPESGREYKNGIRQISFKGYTAFYSFDENLATVFILHIIDLTKPLDERGNILIDNGQVQASRVAK